jgi:hypothetical protein
VSRAARIDPDRDITVIDHVRTLNRAAALIHLGSCASPLVVERCLDDFLRTSSPNWLDETLGRLYSPHARGPRTLAAVMSDPKRVAGVTDSWMERVTSSLINVSWMPTVTLQHRVEIGDRTFFLDVAVPDLLLGIEAHSRSFHWGPGNEDADNIRDLQLASAGWHLSYVTWSQLLEPQEFVRLFLLTVESRAGQLGLTLPAH